MLRTVYTVSVPSPVYHVSLTEGKLDSSTLLLLKISLPGRASYPDTISATVSVTDLCDHPLMAYDRSTGVCGVVQITPASFGYKWEKTTLVIEIYRKALPLSASHGDRPIKLHFRFDEMDFTVETGPFTVCSKELPHRAPRAQPKRLRGPPPRRCFVAQASVPLLPPPLPQVVVADPELPGIDELTADPDWLDNLLSTLPGVPFE